MERIFSILLVASTTMARKVVVLDNNEWDSVVVTTSPVKITNSRFNPKNTTKNHVSQPSNNARMMRNCEEGDVKCFYDNHLQEEDKSNPEDTDTVQKFLEKYSSVTNVKINDELRNGSSKAYWNQIDSQKHNHPYDDAKGWVTLDPIPWSTSKVSKWMPNYAGDRPWANGPPQSYPPSSQLWITNNPRPGANRPSAHWGLGANDIVTDNKPSGFPLDGSSYPSRPQPSYQPPNLQNPAIPHGYQPPNHPQSQFSPPQQYQPPTTQNYPRPYDFPSTSSGHFAAPQHNYPRPTEPPYQWQQTSFNAFPLHDNNYQVANSPFHTPAMPGHPTNYPDEGQGEWVLLSTTKGYSLPQRYHDRKLHVKQSMENLASKPDIVSRSFKSKYQENDIDDKFMLLAKSSKGNRKSDESAVLGNTVWNVDGIDIMETHKPDLIREPKSTWLENLEPEDAEEPKSEIKFHRTVRLNVLPALNNTSTLSHDGMLEVDANPQTVEEAQREEERMKKLQQVAVVSKGRTPYKVVPVKARAPKDDLKRRAAVIAAVGAGMIPATMAVLLPVALGRKRRSVEEDPQLKIPVAFFR